MKSITALQQALEHYYIASYVTDRIRTHARLYEHRIQPFALSYWNGAVFRALYVILANHLTQGHTLVKLDDNYQEVLFLPIVTTLSECLECDVATWMNEMMDVHQDEFVQLGTMQDGEKSTMNQSKLFWRLLDGKNLDVRMMELLTGFAMDMVGLFYLFRQMDIKEFCHRLQMHPLVNVDNQGGEQESLTVPTLPLVVRQEGEVAYVWLQRAWQAEHRLASHIKKLIQPLGDEGGIDIPQADLSKMPLKDEQRHAIMTALTHRFTLITGGPGTGKTHTVAHLVMLLAQMGEANELALVAPTGKAAQRMQESLANALSNANMQIALPEAKTVHRLLGMGQDGQARFHEDLPLSADIIIVDEASMLGVELASALFAAVKPDARLILLGDANQLAAVEAGAVLADLCKTTLLNECHATLVKSERFQADSGIGRLAQAIQQGDSKQVMDVIDVVSELNFVNVGEAYPSAMYDQLMMAYKPFFEGTLDCNSLSTEIFGEAQLANIFEKFNQYRILCASHLGVYGDDAINAYLVDYHKNLINQQIGVHKHASKFWYHGRAVMINKNDYGLGLFNGDVGICLGVAHPKVYFEHKPEGIDVALITEEMVNTAYAMTVHKSQGSEFKDVAVVFDDGHAQLLSQELIYTAITRAKDSLAIYATPSALDLAVSTPTERQTGLDLHL